MIEIELTQGYKTIVDDEDADLAELKWCLRMLKRPYAARSKNLGYTTLTIPMHRVILSRMLGRELAKGEYVDHADGDGLNNQRSNLRLATISQNNRNKGNSRNNTSGYKGVVWRGGKWNAQIRFNHKCLHLGCFDIIEDAARAYNEAALKYHGEFAYLNVIKEKSHV